MNDEDILDTHRRHVEDAVACLERRDRDGASAALYEALEVLDGIETDRARRDALGPFALYAMRLGFTDIARMAVNDALALDRALDDDDQYAQDLLTLGTVEMNSGAIPEARAAFEESIDISVRLGRLENAASGCTNLAILLGQNDLAAAVPLLRRSLDYLDRAPAFPETEITTRLALLQALVVQNDAAEDAAAVMNPLYEKYAGDLREDQVHNSVGPMKEAIERLVGAEPGLDVAAWLEAHLPAARDRMLAALDAD